jgi:hypothetical protein
MNERPASSGISAEAASVVADQLATLLADYRAVVSRAAQEKARAELEADRLMTARRRSDTRRKIIVGGAILAAFREGSASLDPVLALLSRRISAPRDRALVGQVLPIDGPTLHFEEPPSSRAATRAPGAPGQRRPRSPKARRAAPAPIDAASAPVMVPKLPAPLEASLLALLEGEGEPEPAALAR